jgi:hypothetical protein
MRGPVLNRSSRYPQSGCEAVYLLDRFGLSRVRPSSLKSLPLEERSALPKFVYKNKLGGLFIHLFINSFSSLRAAFLLATGGIIRQFRENL